MLSVLVNLAVRNRVSASKLMAVSRVTELPKIKVSFPPTASNKIKDVKLSDITASLIPSSLASILKL